MASQAVSIFDIASRAIVRLGGGMQDVVRTRIMVESVDDKQEIIKLCKEHGWVFGREGVRPANTLVGGHHIIGEGMLVEIEFEAVLGSGQADYLQLDDSR